MDRPKNQVPLSKPGHCLGYYTCDGLLQAQVLGDQLHKDLSLDDSTFKVHIKLQQFDVTQLMHEHRQITEAVAGARERIVQAEFELKTSLQRFEQFLLKLPVGVQIDNFGHNPSYVVSQPDGTQQFTPEIPDTQEPEAEATSDDAPSPKRPRVVLPDTD